MIHLIAFFKLDTVTYVYHYESDIYSDIKKERKALTELIIQNSLSLTLHTIKSSSSGFKSIQQMDPYFKDMILVATKEKLANLFINETHLNKYDIAGYVQEKFKLKPFSLQKVLYYIYAYGLEKTGKALFSAKFLAYDFGPVEQDVYRKKKYDEISLTRYSFDQKILLINNGFETIKLIDVFAEKVGTYFNDIFEKQKGNDSNYNYTHRESTPWKLAFEKGQNSLILDKDIIKYHHNELVGDLKEISSEL